VPFFQKLILNLEMVLLIQEEEEEASEGVEVLVSSS
jgi:hypothetical protein